MNDFLTFRHAMHYVPPDQQVGAGVNLMLDWLLDHASSDHDTSDDAQNLLQQLGYTIEEIKAYANKV